MSSRSFFQRICVTLGLIVISACLFYIGKGHTLFIDTNTVTIGDKELRSHASATVLINGKKLKSSMGRAERSMLTVGGPSHTIEIIDDSNTDNIIKKSFYIPTFMNRVIVSIPAILGDAPPEQWVTEFAPPPLVNAPIEKMQYYEPP